MRGLDAGIGLIIGSSGTGASRTSALSTKAAPFWQEPCHIRLPFPRPSE